VEGAFSTVTAANFEFNVNRMHSRSEAIKILQQARDLLADRLTERICESRDQILEDACGLAYLSEIESMYEQLGGRLAHVNAMLANLPPAEEAPPIDEPQPAPAYSDLAAAYASSIDAGPAVEPLALPAPDKRLPALPPMATFQLFSEQIEEEDLEAASRSLAELFAVDAARGRRCAEAFASQAALDVGFIAKPDELRSDIERGDMNGALMLLHECFGLQGLESLGVLQTLRMRFGSPDAHAA
jgi:hypothetical protein